MNLERTAYETDPVENIGEAIVALTHAYNHLQETLNNSQSPEWITFGEQLRAEINKPVTQHKNNGLQISLYEIGVAHAPDKKGAYTGRLGVHGEKLSQALDERSSEVETLLTCEEIGLLPRLNRLLIEVKSKNAPLNDAPLLYRETIYPPLIRFHNECRRLQAFWWL
jgi:hypothetical protein